MCAALIPGSDRLRLQQTLQNELYRRGIQKNVATVITQVLVDREDAAFKNPTKPIGGFMDETEAQRRAQEMDWTVVEDAGRGWRRVVASPDPKEIVELDSIKTLVDAGIIVIAVGGGGIR
jgi:carbamate kinase